MNSRWLLTAPLSLLVAAAPVRAEEPPGCPPGEWFCDEGAPLPAEPEGPGEPPPTDDEAWPEDEGEYPPGDEPSDAEPELDAPRPLRPPPQDRPWSSGSGRRGSGWGLALRVQGLMLDGRSRGEDARLGGVGVSGRYTLNPVVTLDLGLDSILGRDYNGYDRSELGLSLSSLLFLNRHPAVRTYVILGLNTSSAQVDVRGDDQTWGYFGGHLGLGLDIALDSRVALNFDVLAFMRGRTDSRAEREPEFTHDDGRVSNTSGGGILRGGVNLSF